MYLMKGCYLSFEYLLKNAFYGKWLIEVANQKIQKAILWWEKVIYYVERMNTGMRIQFFL